MAMLTGCETLGVHDSDVRQISIDFQCESGADMQIQLNQDKAIGEEAVKITPAMPVGTGG